MAGKSRRTQLSAVLGLACAAVFALPAAAQAAPAADHADTLAALKTFQAAAGPGAGIYAGDSTGSWNLSTGTAVINTNTPVTPTDRYRIGSQTKSFTAATVLRLVDAKKISLDAPIEQYLPGVVDGNGYDGNAITVRQLLQHTSGIPAYEPPLLNPPPANPDGSYALDVLVRQALKQPPASKPGTWQYSNANYLILGMLIEKTTGKPVHQAVTEQIIQPLGLTRTSFPAPGDRSLPDPAVHGYHGVRVGPLYFWTDVIGYDPSIFSTAGAMISTQQDLTAFYQALAAGKVVSPATLAEAEKTVAVGAPGSPLAYGLGLIRHTLPCGGVAWGHDGMVPGYYTETLVTEDGRHASVVTNAHLTTNPPVAQMYNLLDKALCEK
ncbi:serine hydrolase [Streptomyces sp. UNOC14_S4]|uniref:serine hydrolase domain-containing protein n=1 Tax=Streptomyces sp. UNOC14_S4 TaxID=2872340 RepID=UPI001E35BCD3|nr:serine hydrolase domain-containing protein [Streptomyces sp. UNOC14_S4]MCC3766926.1 beta-lactamase family protein [Streptomyces sp. UNOC14_S4]